MEGDKVKKFLFIFAVATILTGCADSVSFLDASDISQVGFWYGIWHGIIAPIAWLVSIFDDSVAVYAIYNNGGWYDFGFLLGVGAFASSSTK